MANENQFQASLIKDLKKLFPGSKIAKNDANQIQGFPDLTILYQNKWAVLECKKSKDAPHRPNQDYYVSWGKRNSFGSFIYPENREEVLSELQRAFGSDG